MIPVAVRTLFVFVLTLAGGWAFPWWWPVVPGFLAGLPAARTRSVSRAGRILAAGAGGGLAWGVAALWIDLLNDGILSARIAGLFQLPAGWMLVGVTALIGGISAALGAWLGARFPSRHRGP